MYTADNPPQFIPFEDVPLGSLQHISCFDADGNPITLKPKIIGHHSSPHQLDNDKTLYYNLPQVIYFPDKVAAYQGGGSPATILNSQKGRMVTYTKDNFISQLNIPYWSENVVSDSIQVNVLYDLKARENYTTTYIITVNTN